MTFVIVPVLSAVLLSVESFLSSLFRSSHAMVTFGLTAFLRDPLTVPVGILSPFSCFFLLETVELPLQLWQKHR